MFKQITMVIALLMLVGCGSFERSKDKQVIDNATTDAAAPDWAKHHKVRWVDNGYVFFKTRYTIRGNERLNGCYVMARQETNTSLLSEMAEDVRGALDIAESSLNEDSEIIFQRVKSSSHGGQLSGLSFTEQYHERFAIDDQERVECFVLGKISISDYKKTKRKVVHKIASADPALSEAIRQKGIKFFENQLPEAVGE